MKRFDTTYFEQLANEASSCIAPCWRCNMRPAWYTDFTDYTYGVKVRLMCPNGHVDVVHLWGGLRGIYYGTGAYTNFIRKMIEDYDSKNTRVQHCRQALLDSE